jgi:hypothetical protein
MSSDPLVHKGFTGLLYAYFLKLTIDKKLIIRYTKNTYETTFSNIYDGKASFMTKILGGRQMNCVYIEDHEQLTKMKLPMTYLYTVVSTTRPDEMLAFQEGHAFYSSTKMRFAREFQTYKVTLSDGDTRHIFAEDDNIAKFALNAMFNLDIVERLEKVETHHRIVWSHGA